MVDVVVQELLIGKERFFTLAYAQGVIQSYQDKNNQ
jgi:hypothetical protein